MGTWISHLRIAETLLAHLPGLDEIAFTLGSLAPDSGLLVDEAAYRFEPPKEVTHFLQKGEDEAHIRDMDFYRTYLADVPRQEVARNSFRLAYFFHLVSDNLWWLRVARPHQAYYAPHFEAHGGAAWNDFKRDWYDLDHMYVRDHPESLFWRVFMPAPNPLADLPFLHEPALHQQLDNIRQFYSHPDPARVLDRAYPFLNAATMARYVEDAAAALCVLHSHIAAGAFHHVPAEVRSALALLPEDARTAYPAPLGDEA